MGGTDFWSNGIHLNLIEAADDPARESWRNIHAMNDLVRDIITTESHLVISALQGNAGAGGVMLALAADRVYARKGVVFTPIIKAWGICMDRSTGPTYYRSGSEKQRRTN